MWKNEPLSGGTFYLARCPFRFGCNYCSCSCDYVESLYNDIVQWACYRRVKYLLTETPYLSSKYSSPPLAVVVAT